MHSVDCARGRFLWLEKSAQAAQSGTPENNGCRAVGGLWLRCGKLYAAVGGVCIFADAYGAAAGPCAADGCMAAAAGAAVSAAVLAHQCREKLLLCGLGCGVFYTVCLLGASLLAGGEVNWQGSNVMLPIALLLGGLLGSAVTACGQTADAGGSDGTASACAAAAANQGAEA